MTVGTTNAIEVFYSYAHEDELLRNELEKHLKNLNRQGFISEWHDRNINGGTEWKRQINEHLNTARIILLLVSPDFMASDYCYEIEMKRALERHERGEACVIPVILRPVDWEGALFGNLQGLPKDAEAVTSWQNRDEAFLDVAKGIRETIKSLASLAVSSSQHIWNIPYRRNPFFTGREDILQRLRDLLTASKLSALSQPQALSGLGGIGKTQLAIEYAYRYRESYHAVLWARADTRDTLTADFVAMADLLHLSEKDTQDQAIVVKEVKLWLTNHTGWLLILDNADDLQIVSDFLPLENTGHILLTTRAAVAGTVANSIEVETMEKSEGSLFLLRRARILDIYTSLAVANKEDQAGAEAIVMLLEGLPLALDQAGAYIEETNCGLSGYLVLYQTHRSRLLQQRSKSPTDHPEPVATTLLVSFQQIEKVNPAAADLLRLCTFLSSDAIPEEVITGGASYLGSILEPVAADRFKLDEAIGELRRFSLIRRNPNMKLLSVHRLVQVILKESMDRRTRRIWVNRTIRAVNRAFPEVEVATWSQCERYLPHAQACEILIEQYELTFPEAARLLHQAASYLDDRAHYVEAETLFQRALSIREHVLGTNHLDTVSSLNNLAILYSKQGKDDQAEPLFQRALSIRERVLGPDHLDTVSSINNLAILYSKQARYEQAESLFQQVLITQDRVLGPDHLDTAKSLNNLAVLCSKQGKDEQAGAFFQRSLSIRARVLGPDHPDIASSIDNLAIFYSKQGKDDQAKSLFQEALSIRERVLGPDHPDTIRCLNNLASLYRKQDKDDQAELLLRCALPISKKVLGVEHQDEELLVDLVGYPARPAVVSTSSEFPSNGPLISKSTPALPSKVPTRPLSFNSHQRVHEAKRPLENLRDQAISGVRRINAILIPHQEPHFAYMRNFASMSFWPCHYTTEDLKISLILEQEDSLQLIGFVSYRGLPLDALDGVCVVLSSQASSTYTQSIDELGSFVFESISPAAYTLEIHLPESIVVINQLLIHSDL